MGYLTNAQIRNSYHNWRKEREEMEKTTLSIVGIAMLTALLLGIGYHTLTKKEIPPQRVEQGRLEIKVQNSDKGNKPNAIATYKGKNYLLIPDKDEKLTIHEYIPK